MPNQTKKPNHITEPDLTKLCSRSYGSRLAKEVAEQVPRSRSLPRSPKKTERHKSK